VKAPDRGDDAPGEKLGAALRRLLAEIIPFENREADRGPVGALLGQERGHFLHVPLLSDVIGGLAHDRPDVERGAPFEKDTGGVRSPVPGGVVKRRPAVAVGTGRIQSLVEKRADDLGGAPGRRGVKKVFGRAFQVLEALRFIRQAQEESRQTLGGGLEDQAIPSRPWFRQSDPLGEEEIDERAFSAPGREAEGAVPGLVDGIDVRAALDENPGRFGASPFARADDQGRPAVVVARLGPGALPEKRGHSGRAVVRRREVERRLMPGILGLELGAFVDQKVDEGGIPAVSGIMERGIAVVVAGVDEVRRFLDKRLDRLDIILPEGLEDLLRPEPKGEPQDATSNDQQLFHAETSFSVNLNHSHSNLRAKSRRENLRSPQGRFPWRAWESGIIRGPGVKVLYAVAVFGHGLRHAAPKSLFSWPKGRLSP
jgi:hypothetical protein